LETFSVATTASGPCFTSHWHTLAAGSFTIPGSVQRPEFYSTPFSECGQWWTPGGPGPSRSGGGGVLDLLVTCDSIHRESRVGVQF
jgi:hypothetical protein